jgi:hypothetical protein
MGDFAPAKAFEGHSTNLAKLKMYAALIWYSVGGVSCARPFTLANSIQIRLRANNKVARERIIHWLAVRAGQPRRYSWLQVISAQFVFKRKSKLAQNARLMFDYASERIPNPDTKVIERYLQKRLAVILPA